MQREPAHVSKRDNRRKRNQHRVALNRHTFIPKEHPWHAYASNHLSNIRRTERNTSFFAVDQSMNESNEDRSRHIQKRVSEHEFQWRNNEEFLKRTCTRFGVEVEKDYLRVV